MKKNLLFFLTGITLTLLVFLIDFKIVKNSEKPSPWGSNAIYYEIENILSKQLVTPVSPKQEDLLIHDFVSSYGNKFTSYLSPEEVVGFSTMIDGDFEGIGAYIEESPSGIYVSGVLPDSPAQKGGILPGDIIQSINGESLFGKTANEAVAKIRGKAGTSVIVGVFSSILGVKKDVTLIRQKLELPIITDELVGDILVVHLLSFNDHSAEDVAEILAKHAGKYKQLLLDLRDNGGGTLESAVDIASQFIQSGKVVATISGNTNETHMTHGKTDFTLPVSLLVNGNTASAAEILASTLHVHLQAPIYGSQTYGKGSVQELFPLSNGGQLKVTTAHWYTADNKLLDDTGLTPDTVILPTPEEITQGKDIQREKVLELLRK